MGMRTDLIHNLEKKEVEAILNLYHNKSSANLEVSTNTFDSLIEKNLINAELENDGSLVSLSEEGLSIAGSIMFEKIQSQKKDFEKRLSALSQKGVSCLVNRVIWKDISVQESGFVDPITEPYTLDESLWYERVLLKDPRIANLLEDFYSILEEFDYVKVVDEQRWCSPEVEQFLKESYKNIMDLSWAEEDSLKYYYFFYIYAQDQRNLIDFTGDAQEYKSHFFEEGTSPPDFWFSSNRNDPRTLISNLAISESRAIGFLEEMRNSGIVNERYYPLSSFSFFSEDDKIFVIRDIKGFMEYIKNKFLEPVVSSLI
jgi:hypothetical protein